MERARKRREGAQDAVSVAQKTLQSASDEVERLENELKELEMAVAMDQQRAAKSSCLEKLKGDMEQVVQEMQQSGHVQATELQESMRLMDTLFRGLVSVSDRARASAAVQAPSVLDMLGGTISHPPQAMDAQALTPTMQGTPQDANSQAGQPFQTALAASGGA